MFFGESGFAMAATVVLGIGSALAGTVGTVTELAIKEIDKEQRPILRTVGEVFSKTLQTGSAALILIVIGSLVSSSMVNVATFSTGAVIVLTPMIHGIIQHSSLDQDWKDAMKGIDQLSNATCKTIHSAVLTMAAYKTCGLPAAVVTWIYLGALNFVTYKKI